MSKLGVICSGIVGQVLADGFLNHGHTVMRASREPKKLAAWKAKAFSCVGHAFMAQPDFEGLKPTMYICGNGPEAKAQAQEILAQFSWE